MANKLKVLLVVAALGGGLYFAATSGVRWWVDMRLATAHARRIVFELADRDGVVWKAAELRGKFVVLSFFRSQCEGCLAERDAIVALEERLDPDRAVLLSVMMDEVEEYPAEMTAATLERMDYHHPVVMANAVFLRQFQGERFAHVTPITWILDDEGRVLSHLRGRHDLAEMVAEIPPAALRQQ